MPHQGRDCNSLLHPARRLDSTNVNWQLNGLLTLVLRRNSAGHRIEIGSEGGGTIRRQVAGARKPSPATSSGRRFLEPVDHVNLSAIEEPIERRIRHNAINPLRIISVPLQRNAVNDLIANAWHVREAVRRQDFAEVEGD